MNYAIASILDVPCLNWTKVGLKCACCCSGTGGTGCLNWTKVGLKLRREGADKAEEARFELD